MADRRIPYFKFYPVDFMDGVRGMTAQEVGLYTMLLCRMYEQDGPIQDDAFRLATYCGMRAATFETTLEKLIRLGKIDRDGGWLSNDRARKEISSRADGLEIAIRAGKASAEKRQRKQGPEQASVERPFNHTDTDTDTVRDTNVSLGLFTEKPAKPRRRKPDVDLPEGWVPSDKNRQDAIEQNFTEEQIDHEAARFRDHHHSKQSRFRDWDAAWRTWIGNARKFGARGGMAGQADARGYGQGGSIASIVARRAFEGKV